jgi:hypothetical protein
LCSGANIHRYHHGGDEHRRHDQSLVCTNHPLLLTLLSEIYGDEVDGMISASISHSAVTGAVLSRGSRRPRRPGSTLAVRRSETTTDS